MDKVTGYKLSEVDLYAYRAHTPLNQFQHDAFHMAGEILELRKEIAQMHIILDGAFS